MNQSSNNPSKTYWGAVAEFDSATAIYQAAGKTTSAGYVRVDSHTPFPVHGIERMLRHGESHLGWFVVAAGLIGILVAQLMMWWMNEVDYRMVTSGKPPYAWPPTIPVTFELMVLFASLTAVGGMLLLNRLPRHHHPLFEHSTFHRVSNDRFFLSIESTDPKFDRTQTVNFLRELGGKNVELIVED